MLTPQQQKIFDYLADGEWHCMASDFYMKDDRKRISELNSLGYTIDGMKCDGRCGKTHSSRVYMRRMRSEAPKAVYEPLIRNPLTGQMITLSEYALL